MSTPPMQMFSFIIKHSKDRNKQIVILMFYYQTLKDLLCTHFEDYALGKMLRYCLLLEQEFLC